MSIFKCKMCGGTIEFEPGTTVGVCEYCGTKQTLPKLDDDRRSNLYERASHFRRNNDFDKASNLYEQILTEDYTDAEAYWSLVLCRYGIEYVEDPATHKRVPTVNRAQFTSVFDDDNYKSAIRYADIAQWQIYEEEAAAINEIQKGILAISQKEDPFDVFICYKEADDHGRRTPDSVLANELYHQLVQEGFKVFYARITLEDKLGTAYEPYIFAALNSSKVMVVLGTRPEYFNAVWVRNEWSRFLALVRTSGGKKVLIPAYRDMDPYDLPEEFSHLQALDMSRLGFMQDLIRGIKKIIGADGQKPAARETVIVAPGVQTGSTVDPLLVRVFLFLEDGEWDRADEFCEQVLNQDPRNAQAYLGKLMAQLHVRKPEDLGKQEESFEENGNYKKVVRFGDEETITALQSYLEQIRQRKEKKRLTERYNMAVIAMDSADTETAYKAAAEAFRALSGFNDADVRVKRCLDLAENCRKDKVYKAAAEIMKSARSETEYRQAGDKFRSLGGYKDSVELAEQCSVRALNCRNESVYNQAKTSMKSGNTAGYRNAIRLLQSISSYRDAAEQIAVCEKALAEIQSREEQQQLEKARREELARLKTEEARRKTEEARWRAEQRKNKVRSAAGNKWIWISLAAVILTLVAVFVVVPRVKWISAEKSQTDAAEQVEEAVSPYEALKTAAVGETITFGQYEQDNDLKNGKEDIEWLVLDKQDDTILVISKYALDSQPYNTSKTPVTWEKSSLRTWLNDTFLNNAFSSSEQSQIVNSSVFADKNPEYSTSPGSNTRDKVFLLSISEVNKYFDSKSARVCQGTSYCYACGAYKSGNDNCYWWLRSPGYNANFAALVNYDGSVDGGGDNVRHSRGAVRPAMWIDLGSELTASETSLTKLYFGNVKVGDEVTFGDYQWTVLDKDADNLLLLCSDNISKGSILQSVYSSFADKLIRSLSDEEKGSINSEKIGPNDVGIYNGIFLLSRDEFLKYKKTIPLVVNSWWLRTRMSADPDVMFFNYVCGLDNPMGRGRDGKAYAVDGTQGNLNSGGAIQSNSNIFYRPAVWVAYTSEEPGGK